MDDDNRYRRPADRQNLAAQGRSFMGPERVMKASPYQRAKSWDKSGA
jgi:hypothetical protein